MAVKAVTMFMASDGTQYTTEAEANVQEAKIVAKEVLLPIIEENTHGIEDFETDNALDIIKELFLHKIKVIEVLNNIHKAEQILFQGK